MSTKLDFKWPFPYPFRRPHWPQPRLVQTMLAVAVFNDQIPNSSFVQGVNFSGGLIGPLTATIPSLNVSGITPGNSTSNPFYLQGALELLNGGTVLQPR